VRFALLDRTVSLEAVLRGLGGGSSSGGGKELDGEPVRRAASPAEVRGAAARPSGVGRSADTPVDGGRSVVRDADRAPAPLAEQLQTGAPPDVNRLAERWDDVVAALRATGKSVAATALEHAPPVAVSARGEVTLALEDANPIYEQALDAVKGDLAPLLRRWFGGVQSVSVRTAARSAPPPQRLTDEMVRTERLATLRRRDPVLGAAIDALDLDLAD
jgi:hypothetical protein